MSSPPPKFVVVGGGIAGVSCAKTLRMITGDKNTEIILLSPSSVVKSVTNLSSITQSLAEFDVEETPVNEFSEAFPGINVQCCNVTKIKPEMHVVVTDQGSEINYSKLCVCTGARPKLIDPKCPYLIGIRDTETVADMESRLRLAKKVLVVGNGGIALELVYALRDVEVVWAIKDKSIGLTFLDPGAAEFLMLEKPKDETDKHLKPDPRRSKFTVFNLSNNTSTQADVSGGSALGPDWHEHAFLKGNSKTNWSIEYECEVHEIFLKDKLPEERKDGDEGDWPVYVALTNGKLLGCDFIVSATGVVPNTDLFEGMSGCTMSDDGGVKVDDNMRVIGMKDVYAAGDVCTCTWDPSPHWHQMRLWTQARQMGIFAAQCMASHIEKEEDIPLDFCFEIFSHVTRFFGNKVVLLGKFNAQGLEKSDIQLLVRITPGKEYVKVVLKNGRMYGALLVGETDLEETFENLILNGMDLSHYGENLLHPSVELEDYFD